MATFDLAKAVRWNPYYARQTGWPNRQNQVFYELGYHDRAPTAEEFAQAVHGWQRGRVPLVADGMLGPKTWALMEPAVRNHPNAGHPRPTWLGGPGGSAFGAPTHCVRLHFRSMSLTDIPFPHLLQNAQIVYRQYGIRVDFASGMSLALTQQQAQQYDTVDGQCTWNITSGEYNEVQQLGGPVPSTDIAVYYVSRFSQTTLLGCGGHAAGRPACIVAARGGRWDTAHEVGHVLLTSSFSPVHSPDVNNLMFATSSSSASVPVLTAAQVQKMKQSPCCHAIA